MNTWWGDLKSHFEQCSKQMQNERLRDWQHQCFQAFERTGLPNSKQEWWRTTPLHSIYADGFQKTSESPMTLGDIPLDALMIRVSGHSTLIADGDLPKGIRIAPISSLAESYFTYLGQSLKQDDGFSLLNGAMFQAGVAIIVDKHTQIDRPICIVHQLHSGEMSYVRHMLILEEHASVELIEYFSGDVDLPSMMNQVTEVFLHQHALLKHAKIQDIGLKAKLHSQLAVQQDAHSQSKVFLMQKGAALSNCDMHIDLNAAHAATELTGLFLPHGKQFHQQRLNVNHHVGDCHSQQNFRGILDEHAQAVFIGRVLVDKDAQKTEAHQSNKNLVLSKTAQMTTCPQLQIFADDVICSHGATVGQLDDDAMFYLQSRGFDFQQAKQMLIRAFVTSHFDAIEHPDVRRWCIELLNHE